MLIGSPQHTVTVLGWGVIMDGRGRVEQHGSLLHTQVTEVLMSTYLIASHGT